MLIRIDKTGERWQLRMKINKFSANLPEVMNSSKSKDSASVQERQKA